MDGKRIQDYWSKEIDALIETYQQFERLLPNPKTSGATHRGEDGRYVEDLISSYLQKFLPSSVEVLTGFILRPAVKTGLNSKVRKDEKDSNSTQLDLIVYDSANYPIFQRFGRSVIVPPEGVIGIISVKKHLNDRDIQVECEALLEASKLCVVQDKQGKTIRGPFLALVSAKSNVKKITIKTEDWIFNQLNKLYNTNPKPYFDDLIGYIGAFDEWSFFKRRPSRNPRKADYIFFNHKDYENHLSLQFLLTGILSVFYDATRSHINRPGFTAFPSKRDADKFVGSIDVKGMR